MAHVHPVMYVTGQCSSCAEALPGPREWRERRLPPGASGGLRTSARPALRRQLLDARAGRKLYWIVPSTEKTAHSTLMPDIYFARYLPLVIHMVIAFAMAGAMVVLSTLVGRHRYSRAKFQPYECGMAPVGDARERFSVKFYMVAMLFILFDVEAVFLYPWAVLLKELKMFGFWEMLVYIGIVLVGLFYIWKKGVLEWAEPRSTTAQPRASEAFLRAVEAGPATQPDLVAEVGMEGITRK